MEKTLSSLYLKAMIELLGRLKKFVGRTVMPKPLKKLWQLRCTLKRNCLSLLFAFLTPLAHAKLGAMEW
jgi:hypothetical protein